MTSEQLINELNKLADSTKAEFYPGFFKTGPGQYGEGDKFLGVVVPKIRSLAKQTYKEVALETIEELLSNQYHEARMLALMILRLHFEKGSEETKSKVVNTYLANTKYINNWDLVDESADTILGRYLFDKDRKALDKLAHSDNLWENRISVKATLYFIKKDEFAPTLKYVEKFIAHKHDLMHKVCGWMLRELGKRNESVLTQFLDKHAAHMPRTMLRYSVERLPQNLKEKYMNAKAGK